MRFVDDRNIGNIGGAIRLILKESGRQDISEEAIKPFLKSFDESGLRLEGEKVLQSEIHRRYGRNARWRHSGEGPWLVPLPHLRFDALPSPKLTFILHPYLVAQTTAFDGKHSYHDTLIGLIGKPFILMLPIVFLQAILDESVQSLNLVSKDGTSTTWNVPGLNEPLTLPDNFVTGLRWALEHESVVSWLFGFGSHGRKLAPQAAGSLLGLQFGRKSRALPLSKQVWSKEIVMAGLTRLYGEQKAKTMFNKESPCLSPDMTNEDALRVILQTGGKGE